MSNGYNRPLARNRRASHDYFIEETYEAGMVLQGTEIKSIRARKLSIQDAHARISNGEAYIINMHIAPYEQGNRYNHDPTRTRKLLLRKSEIATLAGSTQRRGYTLVPLRVYIKNGFAKVLLGLGKGKKQYDRREDIKRRQMDRDMDRAMKDAQLNR